MKFTVKSLDSVPEKSKQEVEEQLLKQHEEKLKDKPEDAHADANANADLDEDKEKLIEDKEKLIEDKVIKDEDVLSYIKNKYNKEISSVDDLFAEKKVEQDLPEDVSTYLKFKKETGRGIEDFVKANKSYDDLQEDQILAEYYSLTETDLDSEDIHYLMDSKFSYDKDLDDESEIKKKNIAKKRELSKAKKYLNDFNEKYRIPLESSGNSISEEQSRDIEAYRSYIEQSKSAEEISQKKNAFFLKKTNEVFNPEFKGFEFKVGDKNINYSYGDVNEMKSKQSDLNNLINKYVGDDGLIKDAKGWHSALSAAMNPERFANYFYEQGKSDAITGVTKKSKNVNMSMRQTPQAIGETGFKARTISDSGGRGLKIKSKNKN